MKEIKSASELIKLSKKTEKIELPVLNAIVYVKRIGYIQGMEMADDSSDENMLKLCLCKSTGANLFSKVEQVKEFLERCPAPDMQKMIDACMKMNFATTEQLEKNS